MTSKLRNVVGLFLALACLLIPTKTFAWGEDCCDWNACNTCCPGPLNECHFSVLVRGGVVPTTWTNRGTIYAIAPSIPPFVFSIGKTPKFDDVFDLPWTVGLELAYNTSDHTQVFLEADYISAEGKRHSHFEDTLGITFAHRHHNNQTWTGYIGARYYFDRCWLCDRVAPFLGFKAGFVHHKRTHNSLSINGVDVDSGSFFGGQTGVSAGAQLGFDVQIWDCVSAVLNFEVVFSQSRRTNNNIPIVFPVGAAPIGGITNLSVGSLGREVSYPITLGLRYEF